MNIQVRVAANQAAATLRAMQAGLAGLNGQMLTSDTRARASTRSLTSWGNQVQWTGRQIQTNFTLPLVAAAAAATRWQMQNEAAFTRIAKVYGTAAMSASVIKNELNALGDAFEALSNHYGVQQKEVLSIAGDWAAAGASGVALAKGVEATLQAMILGELNAADATKSLIAIQAQYGVDTNGLIKIIGTLNSVENETGVSMGGLIQGFARSAGVARQAGVDYRHLAAMIAALSPAAGSAAEAGNALKTIFSRLSSPTKETSQVLGLMGISMTDLNWKSANATEQLQILSKSFQGLSDKQKEVVATVVASRWQINKFSILMRELSSTNGYYQKALSATSDSTKIYTQYQKELNTVLSSNPQRMKQIWVMLQNAATDIIQPMIPLILYLATSVQKLVSGFSNLNPSLQKLILFGAVFVAAIGPILRYTGSLLTLFGILGTAIRAAFSPIGALFTTVGSAAVTGVAALWAIWVRALSGLAMISTRGWTMIVAVWRTAGLVLRVLMTVLSASLATSWAGMMAWLSAATRRGMAALGVAYRTGLVMLAAIQLVMGRLITGAFTAFMMGIAYISSYVYPLVLRAWTAMYTGMYVIVTAGRTAILAGYRAMAMGLAPLTVAAGRLISAAWYGIQLASGAIIMAGLVVQHAIWRTWVYGLGPLTSAGGRLITAAWLATLRAQAAVMAAFRTVWTSLWGSLVAIAAWGSRMIALATTLGTTAMTLMAGVPGRLLGLFRIGWVALIAVARAGAMGIISGVGSVLAGLVSAISWPVVAAVAAVAILLAAFWDDIVRGFENIKSYFTSSGNSLVSATGAIFGSLGSVISRVFNMLPNSVKNAMVAVVRLVSVAAHKVYELFSYINPFAHHSPSLVENVTNGMAAVRAQFATLSDVEKYVMSAYNTVRKFGGVANSLGMQAQNMKSADDRKDIAKVAPQALPAFDALTAQIRVLTPILNLLDAAVQQQQRSVDGWQVKLDAANASLDVQQKKLDGLRNAASALSDELDAAKQTLQNWADTPIKGQQAMSDAIFNNQQAQKALQLQMMKMEDVAGPLDTIKSKMSAINGEMDTLRGMRQSLQQQGAGSDILSVYDDQLSKLQGQGSGLSDQAKALQDLQDQIDKLGRTGQELDLQNSLEFDGLTRQIELASKSIKEMPFSVILAGVTSSKIKVDDLTKAYDAANKAVENQKRVVDAAANARDAIQAGYDREQAKLKRLKDAYDLVNNSIQQINDSLQKMNSFASGALEKAKSKKEAKLTQGAQNFVDAAGGNFADVGSDLQIGREGGLGDQSAAINDFTKQLAKETSGMFGGLNPLAPLKKYWDRAWRWLRTYVGPLFTGLGDLIDASFAGMGNPFSGTMGGWTESLKKWVGPAGDMFNSFADTATEAFSTLWGWISKGWKFIQPLLKQLWDGLVNGLIAAWGKIGPEIAKFKDLLAPIGEAFSNLWTIVKPILFLMSMGLASAFLLIVDILKNTLGPIFSAIGGIIAGAIRILRGLIEFVIGVFTGDWSMAWKGIKDIIGGAWDIIVAIVVGAWNIVWGVLKGAIEYLGQVFGLIWSKAILPAWNYAMNWLSGKATSWGNNILGFFKGVGNWFTVTFSSLWSGVSTKWNGMWSSLSTNAVRQWNGMLGFFKGIYNWFNNTFSGVMASVSKSFSEQWSGIVKWFEKAAPWIIKPLKSAINQVIGVINGLVHGLNKVSDFLPGLDWNIGDIPLLARGGPIPGRRVGNGFVTNGARAIVGEGNPVHPEFVVPTDPMYRSRALGLWNVLGKKLGAPQSFMGGVPAYKSGGILGTIKDSFGSATDFVKGLPADLMSHIGDGVATYIMKPFFKLADPAIKRNPWEFTRGAAYGFEKKLTEWLSFADSAAKTKVDEGGIGKVPAGQVRDWISQALGIIQKPGTIAPGIYNIIMHESGGNPRAINLTDSNAKAGHPSKGIMQTIDSTFSAYAAAGHGDIWNPVDNIIAGTRYALSRYGQKWLESGGNKDSNGNYIGYKIGGILGRIPGISRAIPSLAQGAYIRRSVGGTVVRVGEGRTDEAVVPLPNGKRDFGSPKTYHFHGDMNFPNITSGEDAQRFLENLESLAEG